MINERRIVTALALVLISSLLAGCSTTEEVKVEPVTGKNGERYQVSVSAGGREIRDFSTPLVHRLSLPSRAVDQMLKAWPDRVDVPFDGSTARDTRGKVMGVKVARLRSTQATELLGLRQGDIVTAVNAKRATTVRDMGVLLNELREKKSATLTLEREGRPHKILYYLAAK